MIVEEGIFRDAFFLYKKTDRNLQSDVIKQFVLDMFVLVI